MARFSTTDQTPRCGRDIGRDRQILRGRHQHDLAVKLTAAGLPTAHGQRASSLSDQALAAHAEVQPALNGVIDLYDGSAPSSPQLTRS
jgi:hypothetical protein